MYMPICIYIFRIASRASLLSLNHRFASACTVMVAVLSTNPLRSSEGDFLENLLRALNLFEFACDL